MANTHRYRVAGWFYYIGTNGQEKAHYHTFTFDRAPAPGETEEDIHIALEAMAERQLEQTGHGWAYLGEDNEADITDLGELTIPQILEKQGAPRLPGFDTV